MNEIIALPGGPAQWKHAFLNAADYQGLVEAVNLIFMEHFQKTAQAYFTIRRLERAYGHDRIRQAYEALRLTSRDSKGRLATK